MPQIARLQEILEQLSQRLGTSDRPSVRVALVPLLDSALDKTANLFTVQPPRSPGAEKRMSYSLNVNAKYHTHMDDAPARAAELEKDLKGAKLSTEGVKALMDECKLIAGDLAKEHSTRKQTKYRPAAFVSEDDYGNAREGGKVEGGKVEDGKVEGGKVQGEGKVKDGVKLEERMKKAEIKSERFL